MTDKEMMQRREGRIEGEHRMLALMEKLCGDRVQDLLHDTTGMCLVRAYGQYQVPDYGQTYLDKQLAAAREGWRKEQEELADRMAEEIDDEDDIPPGPMWFEISNEADLEKLGLFMKQHRRCRYIHHDMSGACFTYSVTPSGLGPFWSVECSCGERILLDGDVS